MQAMNRNTTFVLVLLCFTSCVQNEKNSEYEKPLGSEAESILTGQTNFRDLGGYETKDGRTLKTGIVFRSGHLNHLSLKDVELLTL